MVAEQNCNAKQKVSIELFHFFIELIRGAKAPQTNQTPYPILTLIPAYLTLYRKSPAANSQVAVTIFVAPKNRNFPIAGLFGFG